FTPIKKNQKLQNSLYLASEKELSALQQEAIQFIDNHNISLLFGDTGSGKTEIYIQSMIDSLKDGGSCILLMPEISLTPQMEKRLKEIFSDNVAIWHSKITKLKKEKILNDIYDGKINIVAGARSALFLPLKNLKLIIVDEEHDDAYKSNSKPRFNAKDLAIYMANKLNIKLILGSATPSINSYQKFEHFRLKGNYFNSNKNVHFDNNSGLNSYILNKIDTNLKNKKQTIVFIPTRENFKYLICQDCSKSISCPFCSVSMSIYFEKNYIKCHYCNYTEAIPKVCPSCKSANLTTQRVGTTQIEDELKQIFQQAEISKFDRDEIKSDKKLREILKDFNDKKIDILVGTQMLSKGHDYKDVSLAIILGIDYVLNLPDFRAREKALSLALQIAGRSGRFEEGEVVIQTKHENFFKKFLDDYELFLKDELNYRVDLYPPFVKIARVVFVNRFKEKAKSDMECTLNILNQFSNIEIVGAGECLIEKIADKYRYNIIVRSKNVKALLMALQVVNKDNRQIDMDCINFF
ncbi:MAG: primosomal protein N', partial [Campylobacterales bacterium]|nr:primosomal protein N' [Campylobacterales bacterium]